MNRGYVIVAINSSNTDYLKCARTLRDSIHRVMPDARVSLLTNQNVSEKQWDNVIRIKDTDDSEWKLGNDWQIYHHSPYEYTIKLEADMYIPRSIEWWWEALKMRDLHICTTIRDYRGNISNELFYRRTFVENKLPQTYNAITYFRKSKLAEKFYDYVENVFKNWKDWVEILKYSTEDRATTDVVYAIASRMIGEELTTMPQLAAISMAHMKPAILGTKTSKWHEELVWEISPSFFRINSFVQLYPVHYWNKEFSDIISERLNYE